MFIHFFCLCPLGLATKLNFNISKEAYCLLPHQNVVKANHIQPGGGGWVGNLPAC